MKHDCPWCGINLKWRYLRQKPLAGEWQILPLMAVPVCPGCGGLLQETGRDKTEPRPAARRRLWLLGLLWLVWVVCVWMRQKLPALASLFVIFAVQAADVMARRKQGSAAGEQQKYRKYEDQASA